MISNNARPVQGPTRRTALALLAGLTAAPSLAAAGGARLYALDAEGPRVGFTYLLDGTPLRAAMPVTRAEAAIDPTNLGAARIDVAMDASAARIGLNFADTALARADMLDTANHPELRFVATDIRTGLDGLETGDALVLGNLTMRGVTRPISLTARMVRTPGLPRYLPDAATMRLTGEISRKAFGATGYPGLVGDRIAIKVDAPLRAV
ncbi:YceI family protein [Marinibacterium sp. SX1]|uniref:YceI family protein n=1 Tax=Marinibacterium sp. SX1 TaxID=3388424 RepID=UPI003D16A4AD